MPGHPPFSEVGKQRTSTPVFLDAWQGKELWVRFADVWQTKSLEVPDGNSKRLTIEVTGENS